jgi:Flp pilus assembly CpaF family ATPase
MMNDEMVLEIKSIDNGAGDLIEMHTAVRADTARRQKQLAQIERVQRVLFGDAIGEEGVTDVFADPPNHGEEKGLCSIKKKKFGKRIHIGYAYQSDVEMLASLAAGFANREINRTTPRLALNLPSGERIQAHLPPVSLGPTLAIRIPMKGIVTLDQFAEGEVMDQRQIDIVRAIVDANGCLAISGMMGSGKTTLQRAINEEPRIKNGRPVYIMDTVEYLPTARDGLVLMTSDESDPPVRAQELITDGLREDATHLIPTEVRGGDATYMIEAWTTGHPGNCTMHTGSARLACDRIAQMVGRSGVQMDNLQMRWIAQAVNFVIQIRATEGDNRIIRKVTDIMKVTGFDPNRGFEMEPVLDDRDVRSFMRERSGLL